MPAEGHANWQTRGWSGKRWHVFLLFILGFLASTVAQASAEVPLVAGQVTSSASAVDFEVNGHRVLCNAKTKLLSDPASAASRISWSEKPYLGEPLRIYGRQDHQRHAVLARRVVFAPLDAKLSGKGIIDRMLAPQPGGAVLVRADGYPILLTSATQISLTAPLRTVADVSTNMWLQYQGHQRPDGVLVAEKAALVPNTVSDREDRLHDKYDYDPGSVSADAHENGVKRYIAGADPKLIPPARDTAMQDRVQAIGEQLIPKYQRALPDQDPTKISFQFQVIESGRAPGLIWLANGTILLPIDLAARLQSDDRIAAYLALGMAAVVEKQELRFERTKRLLEVAQAGSGGLGPASIAFPAQGFFAETEESIEVAERQQRIRVALALLHDAGFDLTQVPRAMWMLSSKKPATVNAIPIPDDAIYAYAMLGAIWRNVAWERNAQTGDPDPRLPLQ